ncbi:MAG: hypothetical protein ACYSSO_04265 [Planctomycetota bacterium]|jgi:hypothetical protein
MRQLLICSLFLLFLGGCNGLGRDEVGVEQAIEGEGEFPEFLVGTWRAKGRSGWEVVLEPDGTISSAVIRFARVRIRPNQKTEIRVGKKGKLGIFEAGDCEAYYDPTTHDMSIIIEMKRVYAEMGGGVVDGTCKYYISGIISEEGENWDTDVVSVLDLSAQLPEPNSTEEEPALRHVGFFRTSAEGDDKEHIIFTKVKGTTPDNG